MKLPSGKRLGQSESELMLAVSFSFFLHSCAFVAALYLYIVVTPKADIPPFYSVKLVGQPLDLPQPQETAPAPAVEQPAPKKMKPAPKPAKQARKMRPAVSKKGDLPELSSKQSKPAKQDQAKTDLAPSSPSAMPAAPSAAPAAPAAKVEGVAVGTTSPEFKFPPYLAIIREKIERNWSPPPGVRDMKVKVLFRILRSGRIGDTKLEKSSGNFYFDQAAMRAILISSPFPPLPEGFYKEFEIFSVDLMERD